MFEPTTHPLAMYFQRSKLAFTDVPKRFRFGFGFGFGFIAVSSKLAACETHSLRF
jgi:hypothetical protein